MDFFSKIASIDPFGSNSVKNTNIPVLSVAQEQLLEETKERVLSFFTGVGDTIKTVIEEEKESFKEEQKRLEEKEKSQESLVT